jgi:hypothetical protein
MPRPKGWTKAAAVDSLAKRGAETACTVMSYEKRLQKCKHCGGLCTIFHAHFFHEGKVVSACKLCITRRTNGRRVCVKTSWPRLREQWAIVSDG